MFPVKYEMDLYIQEDDILEEYFSSTSNPRIFVT
jgi:hypothetical protein